MATSFFLLTLVCALEIIAQETTIDPSVLLDIFGTPPTTQSPDGIISTTQGLEDTTRKTTDSSTTFVDETGQQCKCLPYYLCNDKLEAVDINNTTVTGWGTLDIRFRENDCQESVERCCKVPATEVTKPTKPTPVIPKGCGYRNPSGLDFTLSGGSGLEALFGEYPWVVALLDSFNNSYSGVGALIHPNVIMTGGHIAAKFIEEPNRLTIRAGEWDTQTSKERFPYQERNVKEIIIHKDFHPKTLYNNIALLRIEEPVTLAEHVNVICLPEQDMSFDKSKDCVANGWGKDVFGVEGRYAVILKKVVQDVIPFSRCNDMLKRTRLGPRFELHRTFLCAGGLEGKDTCKGDGGAPFACPMGNNRFKLAGLVSWGIGCGEKDHPAVYARVSSFRNWVDDIMKNWGYGTDSYQA